MKSFTISCLICAINLNFAKKKIAQKGKRLSRLPEVQKVAPDGKSCSRWQKLLKSYNQAQSSLQASSPIWVSEVGLARTRETRFTRPNRRACSQAKHNRDTPTSVKNVYNRVKEWSLPWGCLHIKLKPFASVEPLPG